MTHRRPFFCLLLISILTVAMTAAAAPLYFVQLTDTHFGKPGHVDRVRQFVKEVNALPMEIAFVVLTGDIATDNIDKSTAVDDGMAALKELTPPLHALPGNHDILVKRPGATLAAYRSKVGNICSVVDYGEVRLILLYTEPLRKPITVDGYDPIAWLSEELKKAGDRPVILCHHTPSVDDFYRNRMHDGWPGPVRDRWVEVVNSANVKGVIAGHFHRDEHHWLGDVPLYVAPPIASYWDRQGAYRIYSYENGRLSYRTRYLE